MNLPSLDRRRLLIGLAAASTAATVSAVPALAAIPSGSSGQLGHLIGTSKPPLAENPELIRLGELLPAAEAEFTDAERGYREVVGKWEKRWPLAPDVIVKPYHDDYSLERGLTGAAINPDGSQHIHERGKPHARSLFGPDDFAFRIDRIDGDMRRKRSKHPLTVDGLLQMEAERAVLVDGLAAAREYEAAKEQVLSASGYAAAAARRTAAHKAVGEVVGAIMAQPETTMAGIIIKAQALSLWGRNPQRIFHIPAWEWPHQFAASVLRIAGDHQKNA
jgi:hypothetical protein